MTTYSNPAKALAVLTFTSGVSTDAKAIELFDLIAQAEDDVDICALFDEHDFCVWNPVEGLSLMEWAEEINTLAQNYDRLTKELA